MAQLLAATVVLVVVVVEQTLLTQQAVQHHHLDKVTMVVRVIHWQAVAVVAQAP
jgi:hypothetical protein